MVVPETPCLASLSVLLALLSFGFECLLGFGDSALFLVSRVVCCFVVVLTRTRGLILARPPRAGAQCAGAGAGRRRDARAVT